MPKTTVYKYSNSPFEKNKVGFTKKRVTPSPPDNSSCPENCNKT